LQECSFVTTLFRVVAMVFWVVARWLLGFFLLIHFKRTCDRASLFH